MNTTPDFYRRVLPVRHKLYRFAFRILGSVEEAEDVVQEVLIKTWTKREELPTLNNVEAWCMRVTKNMSLDRLRRRQKREYTGTEALDIAAEEPGPLQWTEQNEFMEKIQIIIQKLPENQRMVLQLREIEGYSYKEIEEVLEMTSAQVKVNLHRARTYLRKKLTQPETYG